MGKEIWNKMVWSSNQMTLNDILFKLEFDNEEIWELRENSFLLYKPKSMFEVYEQVFEQLSVDNPNHIIELGIWDAGSLVYWFERFRPNKLIGIDIKKWENNTFFQQYIDQGSLSDRLKTYWNTNQADSDRLHEIIALEFQGNVDLIIDDASHLYEETKTSFEALFPYLKPNGLYIIEDWAWDHWEDFQNPDHPWFKNKPLTSICDDIVRLLGSTGSDLISQISVFQQFIVIKKGQQSLDPRSFRLDDFIITRQNSKK
ncbi:MAG: class I SAM-dependent methyltransferase [Cyclobacteriaceae bacterium]